MENNKVLQKEEIRDMAAIAIAVLGQMDSYQNIERI